MRAEPHVAGVRRIRSGPRLSRGKSSQSISVFDQRCTARSQSVNYKLKMSGALLAMFFKFRLDFRLLWLSPFMTFLLVPKLPHHFQFCKSFLSLHLLPPNKSRFIGTMWRWLANFMKLVSWRKHAILLRKSHMFWPLFSSDDETIGLALRARPLACLFRSSQLYPRQVRYGRYR